MKNWVTIPRKNVGPALAWAKKNCPTYITNDYSVDGGRTDAYESGNEPAYFDFFFGASEAGRRDMTAFTLRWS